MLEPIQGAPAAIAVHGDQRALVIADYHAGIERTLREEGVELDDSGDDRRTALLELVDKSNPDSLIILGDLVDAIGDPLAVERTELEELFEVLAVPVTLVKGNHDGVVEPVLSDISDRLDVRIDVTAPTGYRFGPVGFVHGHTWPGSAVLAASILCVGHEHPVVRLQDDVGGYRFERAWLRGSLNLEPFREYGIVPGGDTTGEDGDVATVDHRKTENGGHLADKKIVVFPAFNDRTGRSAVNTGADSFLSPFLPEAFEDCEAYLLDGTRLGPYRTV